MVDILRGHELAKVWLQSVDEIGMPGLVAMELIQGCQNAREQRVLEKELSQYQLYWPDVEDCNRAVKTFASHHLSDSIGLLDALIAETQLV